MHLQGKIGKMDAEVIEQAISKLHQQVFAIQDECKKKEEKLRSIVHTADVSNEASLQSQDPKKNLGPGCYQSAESFESMKESKSYNISLYKPPQQLQQEASMILSPSGKPRLQRSPKSGSKKTPQKNFFKSADRAPAAKSTPAEIPKPNEKPTVTAAEDNKEKGKDSPVTSAGLATSQTPDIFVAPPQEKEEKKTETAPAPTQMLAGEHTSMLAVEEPKPVTKSQLDAVLAPDMAMRISTDIHPFVDSGDHSVNKALESQTQPH